MQEVSAAGAVGQIHPSSKDPNALFVWAVAVTEAAWLSCGLGNQVARTGGNKGWGRGTELVAYPH